MKSYTVYGAMGSYVHELSFFEGIRMCVALLRGRELDLDGVYRIGKSAYRTSAPAMAVSGPRKSKVPT